MHLLIGDLGVVTIHHGQLCRAWIGTFVEGGMPILVFTAGVCTATPTEWLRVETELNKPGDSDFKVVPLQEVLDRFDRVVQQAQACHQTAKPLCLMCGAADWVCQSCKAVMEG